VAPRARASRCRPGQHGSDRARRGSSPGSRAARDCRELTLHREAEVVELHAWQRGLVGTSHATLSDDTNAELDALLEALVSGEQSIGAIQQFQGFGAELIKLWLPALELVYSLDYPPTGVVELDALLWSVLDDLSECRTTTRLVPDSDCEKLLSYAPG